MSLDVAAHDIVWIGNIVEQIVTSISADTRIASHLEQKLNVALVDLIIDPLPAVHFFRFSIQVPVRCLDQNDCCFGWSIVGLQELPELCLQSHQKFVPHFDDIFSLFYLHTVIRFSFLYLAEIFGMQMFL